MLAAQCGPRFCALVCSKRHPTTLPLRAALLYCPSPSTPELTTLPPLGRARLPACPPPFLGLQGAQAAGGQHATGRRGRQRAAERRSPGGAHLRDGGVPGAQGGQGRRAGLGEQGVGARCWGRGHVCVAARRTCRGWRCSGCAGGAGVAGGAWRGPVRIFGDVGVWVHCSSLRVLWLWDEGAMVRFRCEAESKPRLALCVRLSPSLAPPRPAAVLPGSRAHPPPLARGRSRSARATAATSGARTSRHAAAAPAPRCGAAPGVGPPPQRPSRRAHRPGPGNRASTRQPRVNSPANLSPSHPHRRPGRTMSLPHPLPLHPPTGIAPPLTDQPDPSPSQPAPPPSLPALTRPGAWCSF